MAELIAEARLEVQMGGKNQVKNAPKKVTPEKKMSIQEKVNFYFEPEQPPEKIEERQVQRFTDICHFQNNKP